MASPRILFAAGPGNVIGAHKYWRLGMDDPGQMSVTFSSEFEQFCEESDLRAYLISSGGPPAKLSDGRFVIEHRPKKMARGIRFHLVEISYGLGLLISALRFRADFAVIQSGTTHFFLLSLFSLFSIKVIPVLHNTLWPAGFPPRSIVRKIILFADAIFFRWFSHYIICVSPECSRQVQEVARCQPSKIILMKPQFDRNLFSLRPPLPHVLPLKILFAGRITREKGVFDLLEIITLLERRRPGAARLTVCGDGPDLEELRARCKQLHLLHLVDIRGRVEPNSLRDLLQESHAAIVPTRSGFEEGLAMTAVEPILLGRPIIASPVVPALEMLRDASVLAETDNVNSFVEGIWTLVEQPAHYRKLVDACTVLREQFFDPDNSFRSALRLAIFK